MSHRKPPLRNTPWNDAAINGRTLLEKLEDRLLLSAWNPAATLAGPIHNGSIMPEIINSRGYIDVVFTAAEGQQLNEYSILDTDPEFTLSGSAATGVVVFGSPTLVEGTQSTYRYAFSGAFTAGTVMVGYLPGEWSDLEARPNLAATETFLVGNNAPVLDNTGRMELAGLTVGQGNNQGNTVAEIIASAGGQRITDNPGSLMGIAVVRVDNANGTWQYSINGGGRWLDFGDCYFSKARLLSDTARIRFVPNEGFMGTSDILFRAWDQTKGFNGQTGNTQFHGGSSPYSIDRESASITVSPLVVNTAPVLAGTTPMVLNSIMRNEVNNAGTRVIEILAGTGGQRITDPDPGALQGIAIVSADTANGSWEYSMNDGSTWLALEPVFFSKARLLAANSQTRLRFVPNADFTGLASVVFRAWDQTSGANGGHGNTLIHGGSSAFSVDRVRANISVIVSNTAPVLDWTGAMVMDSIMRNEVNNAGTRVTDILASAGGQRVTDPDPGALQGIAIVSADTANGSWEYSLNDGSTWLALEPVFYSKARLLAADAMTRIRFVPNAEFTGAASFVFRAWDQTSGANGGFGNTLVHGGNSAFSVDRERVDVTVTA